MSDSKLSNELKAMSQIETTLDNLDDEVRFRVLRWAADRYGLSAGKAKSGSTGRTSNEEGNNGTPGEYSDLSEFYSEADPSTESDRALVTAYWFQCREGQEDIDAQKINSELKHLGYGVVNITRAFNTLKDQKPSLVMQTRKAGTTKQARKKYKVTAEGKKSVERMLQATEE